MMDRAIYFTLGCMMFCSSYVESWLSDFYCWGEEIRFTIEKKLEDD